MSVVSKAEMSNLIPAGEHMDVSAALIRHGDRRAESYQYLQPATMVSIRFRGETCQKCTCLLSTGS